ncbi:group 1 glycosyl transferase [Cereibacter changlensis JA139]|uniref:Group 1 glycosyl transferase n=2 Tax=Cereibacter changlensis TaxID=402884 RepID=A0A2T4JRP7_9RHOB|nr:glycosyltransferase [Cereibacter changlensis]PTE20594.1 group 1 glycosyl transferase [Cereibacter changlensis JA139]PZX56282.1 glycosyltransferase involved in cell wall biosynthesis [Cereibacter changlensis]
MKPRVVLLSDYASARGGASVLALRLADLLAARGVKVTLFAGDEPPATEPAGYRTLTLGGAPLLAGGPLSAARGIWNRGARRALAGYIATQDTPETVYHVHGFLQTLSPSIFAALAPVRHRTVIHAHDYFLACPNGAYFDYRRRETCPLVPLSGNCLTRPCDKRNQAQKLWRLARQAVQDRAAAEVLRDGSVVLLHAGMEPLLRRAHPRLNTEVIANPVAPAEPVAAEANRGILYLGDIHAYKGVFEFAEAARRAGIRPEFVGDGQDRAALAAAYPEAVLHGWQDRDGVLRLLRGARALVAPTLGPEPFGLAPVEALSNGVPVLVSASLLVAGDIRRLRAGLSFPPGDVEALARLLRAVSARDGLVRGLSRRAPAAAARVSLTPDAWADRILSLYDRILAAAPFPPGATPAPASAASRPPAEVPASASFGPARNADPPNG